MDVLAKNVDDYIAIGEGLTGFGDSRLRRKLGESGDDSLIQLARS